MLFVIVGVVALFVAAVFIPLPSVEQVRSWAQSVGPAFPLLFFVAHALITVAPFPRTAFTFTAGVLFGPLLGITIAVSATTISAVLALWLVRAIGREAVAARLTHPAVQAIDTRLARRGWLAVGSLRLIAAVPFSLINYCCGVSAVRAVPFVLATIVGVIPGTIGVVVLGDALSGGTNPALLALSAICIAVGVAGLAIDAKLGDGGLVAGVDPVEADSRLTHDQTSHQP
ncbi:TVP38/TMEM64 family protein [Skermania sp. ID1734]|nr:TVP38/TMEM64 family protein [Skermania sp. ID1734]